jgi:hypothetical protein
VRLVEEGAQAGQGAGLAERGQQVVAVTFQRVCAEVGLVPVAGQGQPAGFGRAGQPGPVDELVVFDEAQEDAAQQPVHAGLGDDLVGPGLERFSATLGVERGLPFGAQAVVQARLLGDALAQVGFQAFELARQVGEQLFGIDHFFVSLVFLFCVLRPRCSRGSAYPWMSPARCWFSTQACGKASAWVLLTLLTSGTATPSMTGRPWCAVGSSSQTLGVCPGRPAADSISVISGIRS